MGFGVALFWFVGLSPCHFCGDCVQGYWFHRFAGGWALRTADSSAALRNDKKGQATARTTTTADPLRG
jgi:hypothetical protein